MAPPLLLLRRQLCSCLFCVFIFSANTASPSLIPPQQGAEPACHSLALPLGLALALSRCPRPPSSPSRSQVTAASH